MTRYFTHYWNKESVEEAKCLVEEGYLYLDQAASKQFCKRHVKIGDYVYVVNIRGGRMVVIGRMQVGKVIPGIEDETPDADDFWAEYDHVIAEDGTATLLNFKSKAPMETANRLRFIRFDDRKQPPRSLALSNANPELLDSQTLRGVRELTEESAELLDQFISE